MDDVRTIALEALEEVRKQKEIKQMYHSDRAEQLEKELELINKKLASLKASR